MAEQSISDHWAGVYVRKAEDEVSWFQESPVRSADWIRAIARTSETPIIDIGGGASRLVDALVASGFMDVTVLDVAASALARSKARLGESGSKVNWTVADITAWQPERNYLVWHDRAVFHFMVEEEQRSRYLTTMDQATTTGSTAIIATFALDGPDKCSGLPVQRYSPETLAAALGDRYRLVGAEYESHSTPGGSLQAFQYSRFLKL
ncbi:trans-aconitate 2-methyltransferase [Ferrovibrio sp.]|uniref:class I SAM-dependent methyltransferase n=1 Tax=Ferrovibrio sp. TaxID=1917215 RepID=UPI003516FDE1